MRFLRRSLVGIFLISLTFGLLAWAGQIFYSALETKWNQEQRSRPSRERVFAVNVIEIEPQAITPVLTSFGEVRSRRTLELRATASGTITELSDNFEEGGTVTAGQLLVRIDPSDAQAELDVVRTDLEEAKAEQRDAERGAILAQDELTSTEGQAELREQSLERQRKLLERGVGTEAAVEVAQLSVSAAKQSILSQRKAVANAHARTDQAITSVARWQIKLSDAERSLGETEIYAGFSGTLDSVNADVGGLVSNNEKLAEIVDAESLEVAFRVSTSQYVRLLDAEGKLIPANLEISLDIFGVDLVTHGMITRESAAVGEGQTGRLLFARIDEAKGFRPGDFATVRIEEPVLSDVALIPVSAIDSASTVLLIGEDDRLEIAKVVVLRRQGNDAIISVSGISGREVVRERTPLLGAGIRVRKVGSEPEESKRPENPRQAPDLVELTPEHRAKLVAFVEGNKFMPDEAKERVLGQLKQEKVPAGVVERIESRMGG